MYQPIVVIDRKCTQYTIYAFCSEKSDLLNNLRPIGGFQNFPYCPLNPPLPVQYWSIQHPHQLIGCDQRCRCVTMEWRCRQERRISRRRMQHCQQTDRVGSRPLSGPSYSLSALPRALRVLRQQVRRKRLVAPVGVRSATSQLEDDTVKGKAVIPR